MYIFLLMVVLGIWYIGHGRAVKLIEIIDINAPYRLKKKNKGIGWFIPYYKSKDKSEQLIGLVQAAVIAAISYLNALRVSSYIEGVFIFGVTFIVCTWLIKFMVAGLSWLETYSKMLTLNGAFAIVAPLIILWHMPKMCSMLEIRLTFMTLILSTLIVYGEIIHIVVENKQHMSKAVQIKSILTWLVIILMNLYTLLMFVQFYMNVKAHHFIAAEHLTKEAMVDLFYYLIVTFTTVGFGDIRPSTTLAKIITCLIAISGMLFTGMFMGAVLSTDEHDKR